MTRLDVVLKINNIKMKYKNFEKQISESFLQDSAAVDTDALIASLGIPVPVERERKIAWRFLAGFVLLSFMIGGFYYFINLSQSDNSIVSIKSTVEIVALEEKNAKDVLIPIKENNEKKSIAENVINTEVDEFDNTKEDSILSEMDSEIVFIANKLSGDSSDRNRNKRNDNINNEIEGNGFITEDEITFSKKDVESNINASINTQQESNNKLDLSLSASETNRMIAPIMRVDQLSNYLISEKEYLGLADPECPSFSYRIPWNIALLVEVGIMKPMKELKNTSSVIDSVFALREMNEVSKEAIQLGLHTKISKGNNPLYVRGGLAYTRIAEQMNESYDYTEQDTMRGLISITTSMTGDTVTAIYGDIISETRYTGKSVKHYFLHLWDLPIAVGYERPIAGSYYVGGEVGAQFNFSTRGSGLIFRDVNDYVDLSEVSTKETKVGMSYFGGMHFGKHISNRSSIEVSARFRYYPSKFSTLHPSVEQRYSLVGLHAGYVYRF